MAAEQPPQCDPATWQELARRMIRGETGETEAVPISLDVSDVHQNPSVAVSRSKFGWLFPFRTARGAFGDWMSVHAVDPLIRMDIKANNFIAAGYKDFKEATKELRTWYRGLAYEKDLELDKAMDHIIGGKYAGPAAMFDDETIRHAIKIDGLSRRYAAKHGVDYDMYRSWRKLIAQRPGGIFHQPNLDSPAETAFRERMTASQKRFYEEVERKGMILDTEQTATSSYVGLMRGISNARIRKPFIEQLENDIINPHFGVKFVRGRSGNTEIVANDAVGHALWKELVHNVFGGPTPFDKTMTMTVQGLFSMFGKEADIRTLYKISHGLTSAFYSGVMGSPVGGRPSSIIRQMFQLVPTYAELGSRHTMAGIQRAMSKGGIEELQRLNLITSPIDGLAETVGLARGLGRAISTTSEMSLKLFGVVDQFTRAATAHGAASKFDDYAARGILNRLPGRREFKDEMARLIAKGDAGVKEARLAYMFETVANLQYVYGKANRPAAFRGALGNLSSTLMSYPMNSFEMARMFGKRAAEGVATGDYAEALPMLRLTLATLGLTYAGSEFLQADLRSAFLLGAMPHSLAFPKIGMDTFQAGTSTAEWLSASLFNIGETDYHKHQRIQHYQHFARDMRTFVPGGIFFFEDIPRAIDEGSLARWFALTPKADAINQQARERQALARREAREEKGTTGGGFATLKGIR